MRRLQPVLQAAEEAAAPATPPAQVDTFYPVNTAHCATPSLLLPSGDAWELERCDCADSADPNYPVNCGGMATHRLSYGYIFYRQAGTGGQEALRGLCAGPGSSRERAWRLLPRLSLRLPWPTPPTSPCQGHANGPNSSCGPCPVLQALSEQRRAAFDQPGAGGESAVACLWGVQRLLRHLTHCGLTLCAQCTDLNSCNNHGVCVLGQCQCWSGWAGADCSQRAPGNSGGVPGWAIALIVLSSCAVAGMLMAVVGAIIQAVLNRYAASEVDEEEGREPLLLRIDADDNGSVGTADTEDEEGCGGGSGGGGGGDGAGDSGAGEQVVSQPHSQQQGGRAAEASNAGTAEFGVRGDGAAAGDDGRTGSEAIAAQQPPTSPANSELAAAEPPESVDCEPRKPCSPSPLLAVDCLVCCDRPVQAVLIPCGHVCVCRRCSRRLTRCPICRKDIVRRQRLFV